MNKNDNLHKSSNTNRSINIEKSLNTNNLAVNNNDIDLTKYYVENLEVKIDHPIIREIGKIADKHNYQVYIIGGYVRDYLLGRPLNDFDFTVEGDCLQFAEIVAKHYRTHPILFGRFRTAMVHIGETQCEFVGTRKEAYIPESRNPIVTEGSLYDDIKRRDFTINTLAASINESTFGRVLDVFGGIKDLEAKRIITPLDPEITFSDDPLRIMRAARFASQLKFNIVPELIAAAKRIASRIKIISVERISDEFLKIMASPKPSIGIKILDEMGILEYIFPEVSRLKGVEKVVQDGKEYNHKDVFYHTLQVLDGVADKSDNVWLRFAALLHDIAKPKTKQFVQGTGWSFYGHEEVGARWVKNIFKRMKLPFEHIEYVEKLVRLHQRPMVLVSDEVSDSAIRRLAFAAGEALDDLFTLCKADITTNNPTFSEKYFNNYEIVRRKVIEVQEKDKLREFQSPVRGEEIMEICQIPPCRLVGDIKTAIEEAILDGIIPNEYDAAKEYFLQLKDDWMANSQPDPRRKK